MNSNYIYHSHDSHHSDHPSIAGTPCSSWARASNRKLHWRDALDSSLLSAPRTLECFSKIEQDEKLDFNLPQKSAVAGQILKHCFSTVDKVMEKHKPLVYKFGYCYDAHVRYYNRKFGYVLDREGWDCLLVLYAAGEPISPSFVEASLIQKYKGSWDLYMFFSCFLSMGITTSISLLELACMML